MTETKLDKAVEKRVAAMKQEAKKVKEAKAAKAASPLFAVGGSAPRREPRRRSEALELFFE